MKHALIIAAREFEEKRFVAYAAVAFAVLPFLVGVIPMVNGKSPGGTIVLLAVVLATGFTIGLGVITGASFIGRDLSDGRMSFYFSRPIGSMSIWFGKLTAGIVLIVGCFGLIAAPARFFGPAWKDTWDVTFNQLAATVLAIAVALFLIAHVIGTFARSRSPLIVADFAAAVICGISIRLLLLPLLHGSADILVIRLLIALTIAVVVAIVGGGAWQLSRGRTDRRSSHRALSQFLWSTMAVALIVAAGFVAWVVSATPADLTTKVMASHAAGSRFLLIAGPTRHRGGYRAAFLVDVEDGSFRKFDRQNFSDIRFTRDGNSAIVMRPVDKLLAEIVIYRRGVRAPVETGLTLAMSDPFFVSDDGNRIAVIGHGLLSIYDVPQKRSLTSVRVPFDGRLYRGYFVSPDLFRFYVATPDRLSIFELDPHVRGARATGAIGTGFDFVLDSSASRMLIRQRDGSVTLNDASTGAAITTVVRGTDVFTTRFMSDGRIAIIDGLPMSRPLGSERKPIPIHRSLMNAGIMSTLHVFSSEGLLQRDIQLDDSVGRASFVGDDGTRVVMWTGGTPFFNQSLVSVNIDRGNVERHEPNAADWAMTDPQADDRPPMQPLREVIYRDEEGRIVGWSPATGAKRMITGG